MATISMSTHITKTIGRGKLSRHSSARFLPVAMPSLADRVWINIAIRLVATTTHNRVYPNWAPLAILVAKLPGSIYATLAMKAGPMNGNRRASPRFLLLPDRMSAAAFSVLLNSAGAGLPFAIISVIYTIGWLRWISVPIILLA